MLRIFLFGLHSDREAVSEPHRFERISVPAGSAGQGVPDGEFGCDTRRACHQRTVQQNQQVSLTPLLYQCRVLLPLSFD